MSKSMQSVHNTPMNRKGTAIQLRTQYGSGAGAIPQAQSTYPISQGAGGFPQRGGIHPPQQGAGSMSQGAGSIPQGNMIHPYQNTALAHPTSQGIVGPSHTGMQHPTMQQVSHGFSSMLNPATVLMPPMSKFQHPTQPVQHANPATMQSSRQLIRSIQQPIQSIQVPTQQIQQSQQYQQPQPYQQPQRSLSCVTSSLSQGLIAARFQQGVPGPIGQRRSNPGYDAVNGCGGRTDPLADSDDDELYHGRSGRVRHSSGHKKKGHEGRGPSWLRLFAT